MPAVEFPELDPFLARFDAWATVDDTNCPDVLAAAPALLAANLVSASWVLWRLTGRQYGIETLTLRPHRYTRPEPDEIQYPWTNFDQYPYAVSRTGCGCARPSLGAAPGACSCRFTNKVFFPTRVKSIEHVWLDGVELASDVYALSHDHQWLHGVPGGPRWPLCANPYLPLSEDDTFGIEVRRGRAVPSMGRSAVAELACELTKAAIPGMTCALPARTTSVNRNGVTMTVVDPMEMIKGGGTGITSVDQFIGIANPAHLARRARVTSAEQLIT